MVLLVLRLQLYDGMSTVVHTSAPQAAFAGGATATGDAAAVAAAVAAADTAIVKEFANAVTAKEAALTAGLVLALKAVGGY